MELGYLHEYFTDRLLQFFFGHSCEMEVICAISYTRAYTKEKSDDYKSLILETNSVLTRRDQSDIQRGNTPHQRYLVVMQFIEDS